MKQTDVTRVGPGVGRTSTRERILVAALDLFVERGFDATTVTAIERAVGLAAGTGSFYRHYPSKDEVFVAAVQRYATEYIAEFVAMLDELRRIDDPVERLRRDFHMRLEAMHRFEPIMRLITAERERFPELQRMFTAALEMNQWHLDWEQHRLPGIVMAALVGYGELARLEESPYHALPADDFIDALVDLLTEAGVMPPVRGG